MSSLEPGKLYVIAAPSGTGKTTLVKALIESISGVVVSISHTTRPKRSAEQEGVNYYFVSEPEFQKMINEDKFLEYATVFNHLYGTSKQWVEETLLKGLDVILEIDWQGCQQIQRLFPDCVSIFILPPSRATLSERLHNRKQDTKEVIQQRLADIREAVSHIYEFDYIVMNDDFNQAINELRKIIEVGRLLQRRQTEKYASLLLELSHIGSVHD